MVFVSPEHNPIWRCLLKNNTMKIKDIKKKIFEMDIESIFKITSKFFSDMLS